MKNRYVSSFIQSTLSVLPMIAIVLILSLIPTSTGKLVPFEGMDYLALALGCVVLIVGLAFFQLGSTSSLTKVGEYMGSSLSAQKKIFIVILFSFLLGALITCAEPSILIVASQVEINSVLLIAVIAVGVGLFVVIGVIRIIFHKSLKVWYLFFYFIVFALIAIIAIDENMQQFLPFIFDAGGITTGSATVPFILALGAGIAVVRGGNNATEDSFGLVGMASIGPILSMTLLILFNRSGFAPYKVYIPTAYTEAGQVFSSLLKAMLPNDNGFGTLIEVGMAILPIVLIFVIYELIFIKLPGQKIRELLVGFCIAYVGLVVFLSGVNSIMTPFGTRVGVALGLLDGDVVIVVISFIIGLVTILCEPAVHVLTDQINQVSEGRISKSTVLIALSLGVGIAIALSVIRTIANFNILFLIVPGYLLSVILMVICPNTYSAMAFDAGGTASGPMSVSFIMPMIIGITYSKFGYGPAHTAYYTQSFGCVALIALTPILAIQILGVVERAKTYRAFRIMRSLAHDPDNDQIIHFN